MLNLLRRRREAGFGDAPPEEREKRVPICLPVEFDRGGEMQDAIIVDMTARGAKIYVEDAQSIAHLCIGQLISVRPMGGCAIMSRLRWRDKNHCGVQFVVPMQSETMSRFESDAGLWMRARASRAKIDLRGEVLIAGKRLGVRILDVSSGGARIGHDGTLKVGTPLMLDLDGSLPIPGHVRWSTRVEAGLMFTRLLPINNARHLSDLCKLNHFWLQEVIEQHRTPDAWL